MIVGATKPAQLADNLGALDFTLPAELAQRKRRAEAVIARLGMLPGVRATHQGRNQVRLEIDASKAGLSAGQLSARLKQSQPVILVWDLHSDAGVLVLTLGKVNDETAEFVCERIIEVLRGAATQPMKVA